MIVGGADELSVSKPRFSILYLLRVLVMMLPRRRLKPFDRDRDGLVIGEGAATLILEEYEHASARGARIHAEVVGYGTNSDGNHVTQPSSDTMAAALRLAMADASLSAESIGFVNGHGTATEWGDIAESKATAELLGTASLFTR